MAYDCEELVGGLLKGNPIYTIIREILQESGILLGGCLTVKN